VTLVSADRTDDCDEPLVAVFGLIRGRGLLS